MKIESIPYTANNKVAKKKLPAPVINELSNYKAATTKTEQQIVTIWEEHLQVNTVGINDSFFALGGDSIKAIGLVSKINEALKTTLSIADIYAHQTIAELAGYVKNAASTQAYITQAEAYISDFQDNYKKNVGFKDNYEAVYPMNGVEKGMIFHSLKGKAIKEGEQIDNIVYHEHVSFQVPNNSFDFAIFNKATELLVEKHPVFRKVFDLENQAHIVLKEIESEIEYIDASHVPDHEIANHIQKIREEGIQKKTGLSFSVLWHFTAVKFSSYHYLIFNFHHSLLDGWSLHAFQAELDQVSSKLVEDSSYKPAPLQVTYYDQIVHETAATLNEENSKYWAEEFEGYERLELPKTGAAHQQKTKLYSLGETYKLPLEEVAARHKTSVKHICFAAFVYAMNMLSHKNDFTVGLTTNNRPLKEDGEKLLGCFLNTLPFRARIPQNITWGEYINYIDGKLKELKRYDSMPLYKVVETVGDVTNDQNPMFDVFFNYIDFHVLKDLADEISDWGDIDYYNFLVTNNPIEMHFDAFQDQLNLWVTYSTSIINENTAEKIASYVKAILKSFIENENGLVVQNNILSNEEKHTFNSFNDTAVDYDYSITALDQFRAQAQKTPKAIALVLEEEFMTYRELDELSDKWASYLIDNGVSKDTIVSMLMHRSTEIIVGILAIMKTGAGYLPIDPDQPEARTQKILQESQSVFTITNIENLKITPTQSQRFISISELNEYDKPAKVNLPYPKADDLAYVIYTSGSTGQPKGVMITHKALVNLINFESEDLGINETDRILQFSPYYFDVSIQQIWLALTKGARLVLVKKEVLANIKEFGNYLEAHKITMLNTTPSFLEKLELPVLKDLKRIATSGEECKPSLAKKYAHLYDFFNEYGPTETTIINVKDKVTPEKINKNRLSIGKPIANTQVYVLDEHMNLMPTGFGGELYLAGDCLSTGYLNREDLTNELYLDNPYADGVFYKSGDMGKWNEDGTLEFIARKDEQVKFNGIRVEPVEIENYIKAIEGVEDSAVMVKEIEGKKYFVAYYVAKNALVEDTLREHLLNYIPVSIIPTHFMHLETFPLTSNGKLDAKALPLPKVGRKEFMPATTTIEKQLVQIWAELLDMEVESISIYDSFFEIGGNSLNALTLTNTIFKTFSIEFTIKDIFIKQTVKAIADYLVTVQQLRTVEESQLENAKLIL